MADDQDEAPKRSYRKTGGPNLLKGANKPYNMDDDDDDDDDDNEVEEGGLVWEAVKLREVVFTLRATSLAAFFFSKERHAQL